MRPGIYPGVSFRLYAEADGLNQTKLKVIKRSPKKFHYMQNTSREDTADLGIERAIHTAVLEPDKFNDGFATAPELNLRTNEGKKLMADFRALNAGKEVLKASDIDTVFAVAGAVLSHPDCARLLFETEREVSSWWEDQETGVLCKARVDAWLPKARTIIDLKTTKDASPLAFSRGGIWQYGYHLQAAWYFSALEAHGYMPEHYIIIAVEKDPPYEIGIYRLTDEVIKLSKQENATLLRRYAECKRKDYWPGYTEGIVDIGIPKFGLDEMEARYGEPI